MDRLLRIIFLLVLMTGLRAEARMFYGRVLSETDTIPVEGAVCVLTDADRNILRRDTTYANGGFKIESYTPGRLNLVISKPGFSDIIASIESPREQIDMGILWMSDATTLDELVVNGSVSVDARGRTIVYPSLSQVKASSTSIDLMQKLALPALEANPISRTITVMKSEPIILINGVPSSKDEFLTIAPSKIERIEYSIIPPAKYAPSGQNGYISVTLKDRTDGGSVNLWARSALQTTFFDGSFATAYHQGPSEFRVSYAPSWRNYHDVHDVMEGAYIGDDFKVNISAADTNPFNYFNSPISLRYIFSPKISTMFSATLNLNTIASHNYSYGDQKDDIAGDYTFDKDTHDKSFNPSLDLYFKHDFNERNTLEVNVVGTLNNNKYRRANLYIYPDRPNESYDININSSRRSLITSASYDHNFSDATTLSAGLRNTLSHSRNTYIDTDDAPVLTENNNYAYVSLSQMIKRFYFNISTGLSMYWMKNDDVRHHYFCNNTRMTLQWVPSNMFMVTGTFNYNSGIPGLSQLTDHIQQINPYLYSNGNPDLRVGYSLYYSLRPAIRYKKLTALVNGFYSSRPNAVFSDITYMGDGKFLQQSINAKKSANGGASLQVQIQDFYGLGLSGEVTYTHYMSEGPDWSHTLNTWGGMVNVWYTLKKFTLSAWYKFPAKSLTGHMVSREENGSMLSLMYRLNDHWNFTASWMYMFCRGTEYPSWNYSTVNPSTSQRWIGNNANMVTLSVGYQTDFGSIFRTGQRQLRNSDSASSILKF